MISKLEGMLSERGKGFGFLSIRRSVLCVRGCKSGRGRKYYTVYLQMETSPSGRAWDIRNLVYNNIKQLSPTIAWKDLKTDKSGVTLAASFLPLITAVWLLVQTGRHKYDENYWSKMPPRLKPYPSALDGAVSPLDAETPRLVLQVCIDRHNVERQNGNVKQTENSLEPQVKIAYS